MPTFGPIKRADLISYLRSAGFSGPAGRGKHQSMYKIDLRISIPNPHRGDISKDLLAKLLRDARISREEWAKL
jgi:predicted RNA binding protein YcfA (HicA-like mRNA interferase family)